MTRFLSNNSLWDELYHHVKFSSSVKAAVAFLGNGGADMLPLKKGDTLVVNLGLQTVRQGATSPMEIKRLMRRGVKVFTRSSLHAKFFICGKSLFVGSANVSKNSQNNLDEAATLTSEGVAIRRAASFFDKLCTEPVRPEYLKLCLQSYRPPRFSRFKKDSNNSRQQRIEGAKLWFMGGLVYEELPEKEKKRADDIAEQFEKKLKKTKSTSVDYSHYSYKPRYFEKIRPGDWLVNCILDKTNGEREVGCPQQVLGHDSVPAKKGKRRYLLLSEKPKNGQTITLSRFRRKVRKILPRLDKENPQTRPIVNNQAADFILSLWTPSGRVKS